LLKPVTPGLGRLGLEQAGQPGLHGETLPQKKIKKKKRG
jgi:hypothetical protein